MRPNDSLGVVLVSVLVHVAIFWPGADSRVPIAEHAVLQATLQMKVQQKEQAARGDGEVLAVGVDGGAARSPGHLSNDERRGASSIGGKDPAKRSMRVDEVRSPPDLSGVGDVKLASPGLGGDAEEGGAPARGGDLDSYRFALAKELLKGQRYPTLPLAEGKAGMVELEVSFLEATRSPPVISVIASSGHKALDEAALGALREGVDRIPLPSARGAVRLSVLFEAGRSIP